MAAQPRPAPAAPRILLTRPAAQSARLAAEIAARHPGAEILVSPLMAPVFLAPARPAGGFGAVAFTSQTGVEAAGRLDWPLPRVAFCVGDRTAAAARAAGFDALSAQGDAAALVALVAARPPAGGVLHLRGEDTAGDLSAMLTAAGVPAADAVVYGQRPCAPSEAARDWLDRTQPVIVPVFSPRSARLLADAAAGAAAPLWCAAISAAAAAPLAGRAARMAVADRPDAEAMAVALDALITTPV